jgi:YidC/Oxa1 family membrane protein insertase
MRSERSVNQISAIARVMAYILQFVNGLVNNYGIAIILVTLLLKIVLLPTGIKQHRYMKKNREIQPKLKALQEKYKGNPEELQKQQMELFKRENVNPFSGCLPTLLQMPIFFGWFTLLRDPAKFGVAMAGTKFLGLELSTVVSQQGTLALIIIVAITALSTYWQQAQVATDASQKGMLYIMPLFMAWITATLPFGLAVYWMSNTLFGIIQHYGLELFLKEPPRGNGPANENSGQNK